MLSKLAIQKTKDWIEENSLKHLDFIYSMRKFVQNHSFINIFECMMLDIFYQLLK